MCAQSGNTSEAETNMFLACADTSCTHLVLQNAAPHLSVAAKCVNDLGVDGEIVGDVL